MIMIFLAFSILLLSRFKSCQPARTDYTCRAGTGFGIMADPGWWVLDFFAKDPAVAAKDQVTEDKYRETGNECSQKEIPPRLHAME
jgi:hypothetical protein